MLLALLHTPLAAQRSERPDIIRGRIVGPDGQPLAGALVTVRAEESGQLRETVSSARGAYTVLFPTHSPTYAVTARFIGMEPATVRAAWTRDATVLTANVSLTMARNPIELERVTVREHPRPRPMRDDVQLLGEMGYDAGGAGDVRTPTDGWWNPLDPQRYSVLGTDPSENILTVNGAEVQTVLPNPVGLSGRMSAASGAASKGGTSGGRLAVVMNAGGDYHLRYLDVGAAPASLQWVDDPSDEVGMRSTTLDASLWTFDPLFHNRVHQNTTITVSRRTMPLPVFPTSPEGLARLGLVPDSLSHFLALMSQAGIPVAAAAMPDEQRTTRASWMSRIDFGGRDFGNGTKTMFNVVMNLGTDRTDAGFTSPSALASHAGSQQQTGGFVSAELSRYIGTGFLTKLSTTLNGYATQTDPYLALPEGRVRVRSVLPTGDSTLTWLTFGGNPSAQGRTRSLSWQAHGSTTWVTYDSTHQLRVGGDFITERQRAAAPSNALGAFEFESLEALETGRAMRFTRQTSSPTSTASGVQSALYLDDRWTVRPSLILQYGLRLDVNRVVAAVPYNAEVDADFGMRTDQLPHLARVSPRFTLLWGYTKDGVIAPNRIGFSVTREQSSLGAGSALAASRATGLPSAVQEIDCTGDDVPLAAWATYEADPKLIPSTCLDGTSGQQLESAVPSVRLLDSSYQPPVAWRSTLSWTNAKWTDFQLSIATSFGSAQRSIIDLNLDPSPEFALSAEGGRLVYAPLDGIVPATGATALVQSRRFTGYGRVLATLSDLRSRATEVVLSKSTSLGESFRLYAQYRYLTRREQARGFDQLSAGNPFVPTWGHSALPHHALRADIRAKLGERVALIAQPWVQSGLSYTPLVAGDVNGDGNVNDIAYVPLPSTPLGKDMLTALRYAPASVRHCLNRQSGRIAARNSCTGPWSGGMDFTLELSPPGFPQEAGINLRLINAAGAVDRLLHGSANARGWGDPAFVDPTLFVVTGFDPVAREFRYQVNPRFGQRGALGAWHRPIELRLQVSTPVGPSLTSQQNHTTALAVRANRDDVGRVLPYRNPFTELAKQADDLHFTAVQRDSLQSMQERWRQEVDSIQGVLSGYIDQVSDTVSDEEIVERVRLAQRSIASATEAWAPSLRALLTHDQFGSLTRSMREWIEYPERWSGVRARSPR